MQRRWMVVGWQMSRVRQVDVAHSKSSRSEKEKSGVGKELSFSVWVVLGLGIAHVEASWGKDMWFDAMANVTSVVLVITSEINKKKIVFSLEVMEALREIGNEILMETQYIGIPTMKLSSLGLGFRAGLLGL